MSLSLYVVSIESESARGVRAAEKYGVRRALDECMATPDGGAGGMAFKWVNTNTGECVAFKMYVRRFDFSSKADLDTAVAMHQMMATHSTRTHLCYTYDSLQT